jgi:hypothetical protein
MTKPRHRREKGRDKMTTKWRPDNWTQIRQTILNKFGRNDFNEPVIELAAQALLDEITKNRQLITPEQMKLMVPDRGFPYGWLVFIPADDPKEGVQK